MAKQPTSKGATSRIRFIMLDAEIPEGDLSQLTSAIQNALKPPNVVVQQRLQSMSAPTASEGQGGEVEAEENNDGVEQETQGVYPIPKTVREVRARKPRSMKVLEIDITSEPSFESYAASHVPKNDTERNLVVLAWFKEHRSGEIVTANHVYTCYRAMKWPSGIEDFPSVLRSLKDRQLVKNVGRGEFEINHLGIARVEKMSAAP